MSSIQFKWRQAAGRFLRAAIGPRYQRCSSFLGSVLIGFQLCGSLQAADLPNILWITSEDNGPHLGAYGDRFADTPSLDALAAKGVVYRTAWSNAPVCAPARTTIISGIYPTSMGAQHMRSEVPIPDSIQLYPQYLRKLGYYCTNNSKEDYNLALKERIWDESSGKAHWKNRAPGQPFFAIFNHTVSHESQIRRRPHDAQHDPKDVRVPAYHPDTPETRQDWAQYYDKITEMDQKVGKNLQEIAEAGLAEDTIVFYYGDHGSGMPRSKRWPFNSGLHVPMIVYIPEKWRSLATEDYAQGGFSDRMVSFVDLAPTLLSLAGMEPPCSMQGKAFLGKHAAAPRDYLYGFRGRMDERYDMVRSVRDERFIYIRNYMPHRIYGQYIDYMFQTPTTRVWKEMYDRGELRPPQTFFWETKPVEELYDLKADVDEVRNLAGVDCYQETLNRFRKAHRDWVVETHDIGFIPEGYIHQVAGDQTPYEYGQSLSDETALATLDLAEAALGIGSLGSNDSVEAEAALEKAFRSGDPVHQYWAAMGALIRGESGFARFENLVKATAVESSGAPYAAIVAREIIGRYGGDSDWKTVAVSLAEMADMEKYGVYAAMFAMNALDHVPSSRQLEVLDVLRNAPTQLEGLPGRMRNYVPRLMEDFLKGR